MTVSPVDELLALACALATEAGALVRAGRSGPVDSLDAATKSSATDVVTVYDSAAEQLIVERLIAARPDDAILGEEGAQRSGSSGIRWVVDPIDGTTNYLYDLPGYSVSIAAEDAEGQLVGAVYLPVTDELFAARRGGGATLDGTPIRCSAARDPTLALVGTGFSYQATARRSQGQRVANLLPRVRDIRRLGSAAVDLCFVACGRLDAYYEQYLNPWDLAAGVLIAAEAGATVGSFPGSINEPNGILVAGPSIYDQIGELLIEAAD